MDAADHSAIKKDDWMVDVALEYGKRGHLATFHVFKTDCRVDGQMATTYKILMVVFSHVHIMSLAVECLLGDLIHKSLAQIIWPRQQCNVVARTRSPGAVAHCASICTHR